MRRTAFGIALAVLSLAATSPALPYVEPGDPLDFSFSALDALSAVERAYVLRDGDGRAVRAKVLRLLHEYDRQSGRGKKPFGDMPASFLAGIPLDTPVGPDAGRWVFVRLMKFAGGLYDHPELVARGEAELVRIRREHPDFGDFRTNVPVAVTAYDRLVSLGRAELEHEVRPGGVDGAPFWNRHAKVFAYPPSFDFERDPQAASYRFVVLDDRQARHVFESSSPWASLKPVWASLKPGFVTVFCFKLDGAGVERGLAGSRTFWRSAPFDPAEYEPARRSYVEAQRKTIAYLMDGEDMRYLEAHGRPDVGKGSNFTSYPSKMQSAVIDTMLAAVRRLPERRERALRLARISADYLLTTCEPDGSPLAGFPATYAGGGQRAAEFGGQHMLVYPALAGSALLRLAEAVGENTYLVAAKRIGDRYLALQGTDGSWFLKMDGKSGRPISNNRLVPTSVIAFLEELFAASGDGRYRRAADRAFASIDQGPLVTWNWEGQFEDVAPVSERYRNLTKHNACDTAIYLLQRFPGDARRLAQAREILRYAEDQFVAWRAPCRRDYEGAWKPEYQFFAWHTPVALEQYCCYCPIDASSAKLIRTYLALYAAEGSPLDLAKARALGDRMVNEQDDSGRIRTYFIPEPQDADDPEAGTTFLPYGGDWYNCMAADVAALGRLADNGRESVFGDGRSGRPLPAEMTLAERIALNMERLSGGKYLPGRIFNRDDWGWPGDTEGRVLLALVLEGQALGRKPPTMERLFRDVVAHFNAEGYMGPIRTETVSEQQLMGNGWILRALCAYARSTFEPVVDAKALANRLAENLYLKALGRYKDYPIDPKARAAGEGSAVGSKSRTVGGWELSTDIGAAFAALDGLTDVYALTKNEKLKPLIEEIAARFAECDPVVLRAQTHSTLTTLRALLRYDAKRFLPLVEKRFAQYREFGMTDRAENYNWFCRYDTWTEPCAIVDSLVVAETLWKETGNRDYHDLAARILTALVGHQRDNGGFGLRKTFPRGSGAPVVDHTYEAHWCCTMRGGAGLAWAKLNGFAD